MSLSRRAVLLSKRGRAAREPYAEYTVNSNGQIIAAIFYGAEVPQSLFAGTAGFGMLAEATVTEGCEYIGSGAFSTNGLRSISLPSTLKEIDSGAFQNCMLLTSIELPAGLEYLSRNTFKNCLALAAVTFHGTPDSIATTAFSGCEALLTINVPWAEGAVAGAPWGATNATINYRAR